MTIVSLLYTSKAVEMLLYSQYIQRAGSVKAHWTTYHPRGLSDKDIFMAQYCDDQARLIGTVGEPEAQKCGPATS